jgi:hypothetical protein
MLLNIMAAVIRRFSSWSVVIDKSTAPSTLDRAREYLHDRISEDVSLDDLGTQTEGSTARPEGAGCKSQLTGS